MLSIKVYVCVFMFFLFWYTCVQGCKSLALALIWSQGRHLSHEAVSAANGVHLASATTQRKWVGGDGLGE